jgi:TnpA family transposase
MTAASMRPCGIAGSNVKPFIAITDTLHWDDVLQLAASVRTETVSASLMLKRLGAYPRQKRLALALREIGRIERTPFTLDWLENPQLRRQATAELNKGEARKRPGPAPSASVGSGACVIAQPRRSSIAPATSPS